MSLLNVNAIEPQTGTTVTVGGSGDKVTLSSGIGIVGVSTFTSSGTWTKATREAALGVTIKRVIVEVQGAGGGGGEYNVQTRVKGGPAGGYAKKLLDVSSISSATITVGSGGASKAAGSNAIGNSGGNSSWSDGTNTITGNGGAMVNDVNLYSDELGGTASGGDLNIPGQSTTTIDGYARGGLGTSGTGGNSVFGYGGMAKDTATNEHYPDGVGYGSGGGGGYQQASGAGADGIVIVTEIAG